MNMLTMERIKERALSHLRRDLVLNALDDFVPLSAVAWEVRERLNPEGEAATFNVALSILTDLISTGMVEIGDRVNGKFTCWAPRDNVPARLKASIHTDSASESGWLLATDKAKQWAEQYGQLLDRLRS